MPVTLPTTFGNVQTVLQGIVQTLAPFASHTALVFVDDGTNIEAQETALKTSSQGWCVVCLLPHIVRAESDGGTISAKELLCGVTLRTNPRVNVAGANYVAPAATANAILDYVVSWPPPDTSPGEQHFRPLPEATITPDMEDPGNISFIIKFLKTSA